MKKIFSIVILLFCVKISFSQFYNGSQQDFGKNRIQYDEKFWYYLRHDSYDVYYDKAGRQLADFVAKNVDSNYADIKRTLEFEYSRRIVFVVYNTLGDFRQSNIGYSTAEDDYNVGGTTQTIDNKVVLYFSGDHNDLVRQIRKGIAEVMLNEFLFGIGTYRRILSNSTLSSYPEWFFDGMTEYFSHSWDAEKEEALMQKFSKGQCQKVSQLYDDNAILYGHALWTYISIQYGEKSISNILYMSKLTEDIDQSFQYVLGKNLQTVLFEMRDFFTKNSIQAEMPQNDNLTIAKRLTKREISDISLNADASQMTFVTNKNGKAQLWLYSIENQKHKKIFRIGSTIEQITDFRYPIVQWHPTANVFAFFYEKKNQLWFAIYNPNDKSITRRKFHHFEQILDFSYAPDGTKIIFSGVQSGQTNIFTYNIQTFENEQLTNDKADERFPIYIQNGSKVLFASNRADDSLRNFNVKLKPTYDLFTLTNEKLERIPISSANELKPIEISQGKYLYLSDMARLTNLYSIHTDSTISYIDTAFHYSYSSKNYAVKQPNFNIENYAVSQGTIVQVGKENGRHFINKSMLNEKPFSPLRIIDTVSSEISQDTSIFDTTKSEVHAGNLYKTNFYINKLVNQIDFSFVNTGYQNFTGGAYDYSQNVNMLLKLGIIDLFEDYRLTGAYRFTGSFGSNEYLISLENLSKRLDRQYIFHRQSDLSYASNSYYDYQRIQDNHFIARYKYPFTQLQSISVSPSFRYVRDITLATDMTSLEKPTENEFWIGITCNYVYDNVRKRDVNIYNGTRAKVFAECFAQINTSDSYLCVFGFDFRNYQKIHKNIIFASRIAYSSSFGTSPLLYYLGAVDNWLNLFGHYSTYNSSIQYDHSVDWTYQAIGTNLRGFSQNIRNGNSFAVANFEVRWPIIQYFATKPLRSDILRNFQIIGFADFGGAWSGLFPGIKENAYNYTIIDKSPIYVKIDEMRQPFVCGYGYGFRTRLFGYFIRLDCAWGNDEGTIQRMNQFSIGMDF